MKFILKISVIGYSLPQFIRITDVTLKIKDLLTWVALFRYIYSKECAGFSEYNQLILWLFLLLKAITYMDR